MSLLARWQVTFSRKCLFLSTVIQNFQENFHIQGMNINVFPGWNCVWICCPRPEAAGRAGFKQFTPYKFKITELSGEICPALEFRLSQFPHLISVLWGNPRALPIFKVDEMRRCLDAFTLHSSPVFKVIAFSGAMDRVSFANLLNLISTSQSGGALKYVARILQ